MRIFINLSFLFVFTFIFLFGYQNLAYAENSCCPAGWVLKGNVCESTSPDPVPPAAPIPCPGTIESVIGQIEPPEPIRNIGFGAKGLSNFLSRIVELIYIAAAVIFLFMIIISGLQWILSGGEKEAVASARKRLTWAIIGITVLALAFLIASTISQFLGIELL